MQIMVMDSLEPEDHKTKRMVNFLKAVGGKKFLMVDGHWKANEKLTRAASNLQNANIIPAGVSLSSKCCVLESQTERCLLFCRV